LDDVISINNHQLFFNQKYMKKNQMMDPPVCEFCKKNYAFKSFHCNHCIKKHKICASCILKNKTKMNLRKITKNTIFDSNLKKWS